MGPLVSNWYAQCILSLNEIDTVMTVNSKSMISTGTPLNLSSGLRTDFPGLKLPSQPILERTNTVKGFTSFPAVQLEAPDPRHLRVDRAMSAADKRRQVLLKRKKRRHFRQSLPPRRTGWSKYILLAIVLFV